MIVRGMFRHTAARVIVALCATAGCDSDTSGPAALSTDPVVFADQPGDGVAFHALASSNPGAISVVTDEKYSGTASLKVVVPDADDPSGWLVGGAFTSSDYRNLSVYNALTFHARASKDQATLNIAGFGNDNAGTSTYEAMWAGITLTTTWRKYVIPIPLPEKLSSERGLFFFADDSDDDEGYEIWLDEIAFANVGGIANPRPTVNTRTVGAFAGATVDPGETMTTFSVDGADELISHAPGYFSLHSSNEGVAVIAGGLIKVVGAGEALITARLGNLDAAGLVTVEGSAAPQVAAPRPGVPPGDVISLFSKAYPDVPVDTWWAEWSHNFSEFMDFKVAGDDVKAYTDLIFAGIEFTSQTIDATAMTHFHIDVWLPEGTSQFRVKLVDFGADGMYLGDPDSERELTFSAASVPPLQTGVWMGLEIPLADFMGGPAGLEQRAHLAQLVVAGTGNTAFIDNVYFHK